MEKTDYVKGIRQRAWTTLKSNPGESLVASLAFLVVSLAVSALALIDLMVFILGVAFLELPTVYSLLLFLYKGNKKENPRRGGAFYGFAAYYLRDHGVYRAIFTILKSLLVYFLVYSVFAFIYLSIRQNEPAVHAEIEEFAGIISAGDAQTATSFLTTSSYLLPIINFSSGIAEGALGYVIFHFVGFYGLKSFLLREAPQGNGRAIQGLFALTVRQKRGTMLRYYYGAFFMLTIAYFLGYGLGYGIGSIFFYGERLSVFLGYAGAFALSAIFFPYYCYGIEWMFRLIEKEFASTSLSYAQNQIEIMKSEMRIPEEQYNKMLAQLEEMRKYNEKLEKRSIEDPFQEREEPEDSQGGFTEL